MNKLNERLTLIANLSVVAGIVFLGRRGDLPPKAVPPRVLVQAPPFGWGVVQEAEVG